MAKKISRTLQKKKDPQSTLGLTDHQESVIALLPEDSTSIPTLKADPTSRVLSTFWEKFRLSPIEREHTLLTNMGWLTLVILGPLALLILIWTVYVIRYDQSVGQPINAFDFFTDLRDPLYTTVALSLFFGALVFRYRLYPSLRPAFESLRENDVLRDQAGQRVTDGAFLEFLENYRQNLHSPKRYLLILVFTLFILAASILITTSRGYWNVDPNDSFGFLDILHLLPRWILSAIVWSYVGMLWLWSLVATTKAITDLTPRFQINVQPLHSDKAGGLKPLGNLCSYTGLLIVVIVIPSIVLAIQGTILSTKIAPCGNEIQQFVNSQADMTEERLTDCIYYASSRFNIISHTKIADYIRAELNSSIPLKQLATDYYDHSQHFFQRNTIFANYSIYYVMDFVLPIFVVFAFYVFIQPLFDIHKSMVEYKQRRENETNRQISRLFEELTTLIKQEKLEDADKVKMRIKFLSAELSDIQNYPRWPFSPLPVLRSYLTSSFITAFITYVVSLLKISISSEASGVLNEAIKSIFGH